MQMTSDQQDVMTEIINVGIGRAAASLSELLGKRIDLQIPRVTICNISSLSKRRAPLNGVAIHRSQPSASEDR